MIITIITKTNKQKMHLLVGNMHMIAQTQSMLNLPICLSKTIGKTNTQTRIENNCIVKKNKQKKSKNKKQGKKKQVWRKVQSKISTFEPSDCVCKPSKATSVRTDSHNNDVFQKQQIQGTNNIYKYVIDKHLNLVWYVTVVVIIYFIVKQIFVILAYRGTLGQM